MNSNQIQQKATPQFATNSIAPSAINDRFVSTLPQNTPSTNTPVPTSAPSETAAQVLARQANQGKAGYDVFGNPIAGTATASTTGPLAGASPTVAEAYSGLSFGTNTANGTTGAYTAPVVDEASIKDSVKKRIQAEIDAQNAVYDQKLAEAKIAGMGRTGSTVAINARRGLSGSDFGQANVNNTTAANTTIENSIQNERQAMIASLNTQGDSTAATQIAQERANVTSSIDNHLKLLAEKQANDAAVAKAIAQKAIAANLALTGKGDIQALADKYGVPAEAITTAYSDAVKTKQAADMKSQLDAADLAGKNAANAKAGTVSLSDGEQLWTIGGKMLAENTKSFSPNSNGSGLGNQYLTDPALVQAVMNGTIDPKNVNSRTAAFYVALANAGVDASGASINNSASKKAIDDLTKQRQQIVRTGTALEKNIKVLSGMANTVNTSGIPKYDSISNELLSQFQDRPEIVSYLNMVNTIRSEYAIYLSRGGDVTESTRSEAAHAIPAGLSGNTYLQLYNTLKTEGSNVLAGIDDAIAMQNSFRTNGGVYPSTDTTGTTTSTPKPFVAPSGKTYQLPY